MKNLLVISTLVAIFTGVAPCAGAADTTGGIYSSADTIWISLGTVLIFFMQPGFAMVEIGLTRAKNGANVVMKNFMDFCLSTIAFWVIGFSFMFGSDNGGFIGTPDFFAQYFAIHSGAGYSVEAYLMFQTVFCGTAVIIALGAMAERTRFSAYCIYGLLISTLIYPVSGHWVWGGGWLAQLGFHDFAGSSVVHMVGGLSALVGAKILGPRIGKYNEDGSVNAMPGHSMPLAALGVFILWFAWFGFNGASTVSATGDQSLGLISHIFVNTNMAAASAAVTVTCFTWIRYKKTDVSMTLNGVLAGLVAITAGCDAVSICGAFIIGAFAGITVVYAVDFFDKIAKIDDPMGVISVHGICGGVGTLLTGFLSVQKGLFYTGDASLLASQLIGVAAIAVYVLLVAAILVTLLKQTLGVRVSREEEMCGLDVQEHSLIAAYADFVPVLNQPSNADEEKFIALDRAVPVVHKSVLSKSDGIRLTEISIVTSQARFDLLREALEKIGITGMTVTNVLGFGLQKGHREMYRGAVVKSQLLPKIKIDLVVSKIPVSTIVKTAKEALYTGHYGDGKIFIYDVVNVVKIRTGEQGYDALQDKPIE